MGSFHPLNSKVCLFSTRGFRTTPSRTIAPGHPLPTTPIRTIANSDNSYPDLETRTISTLDNSYPHISTGTISSFDKFHRNKYHILRLYGHLEIRYRSTLLLSCSEESDDLDIFEGVGHEGKITGALEALVYRHWPQDKAPLGVQAGS